MTKRERLLTRFLAGFNPQDQIDLDLAVTQILDICDRREYASLKDFAGIIDRNDTTLLSWKNRGQHDLPAPLGRTSAGDIWDADEIRAWAVQHPKLIGPDHTLFT